MITIALVDKDLQFRDNLKAFLDCQNDIQVTHEASTAEEFLNLLKKLPFPDIALIELHLRDVNGLELNRLLQNYFTTIKVLVIAENLNPFDAEEIIEDGAKGYIDKSTDITDFAEGIHAVAGGKIYKRTKNGAGFSVPFRRKQRNYYQELLDRGYSKKSINGLLLKLVKHEAGKNQDKNNTHS